MAWSRAFLLERFHARDERYDGRFVAGVLSTGIYCLPSCPARAPKDENLRFFRTEEEARAAGLRACKRCKPDVFYGAADPDREVLDRVLARVDTEPQAFADAGAVAAECGFSPTKLNALCRVHRHQTPAQLLTRARVRRATARLTSSRGSVLEAGLASGFESTSAYHDNMRRLCGMAPGAYRRMTRGGALQLELPADHRTSFHARYLLRDAQSPSETLRDGEVLQAIELAGGPALLAFHAHEGRLDARLEARRSLTAAERAEAHEALVRLLGLACDPAGFEARARRRGFARIVKGRSGLRVPFAITPYEGLVWALLGQQVSLASAFAMRRGLVRRLGRRAPEGLVAHPGPRAVARADAAELRGLGISGRKAEVLIELSAKIDAGELDLDALARGSARDAEEALLAQRGIGPWTAGYVMLRALGFVDAVPVGDVVLIEALRQVFELDERPDARETLALMEPFAPARGLATFHLWNRKGTP